MKKKSLYKLYAPFALALALSPVAISTSSAIAQTFNVTNGTVNFSHTKIGPHDADGRITLNGATANQSIKNKQFVVHKIFHVENAVRNESVNYSFNEPYKQAIKNIVAKFKGEAESRTIAPDSVSEYMAIDFMQSLNNNKVEGALTDQHKEGTYAKFRYFVEALKNEINRLNIQGDTVKVDTPNAQNQLVINGLSWGYYLIDEVSTGDAVSNGVPSPDGQTPEGHRAQTDGQHFAASLVLIDTVNNQATVTLKSDYPEITKKIQEDDNKEAVGNDGWNDMADYEIGQKVPYSNTIRIPNMNGYHGYYLAVEDRMDPALTFIADKAQIKLTITKGGKTYTVKNDEYKLTTLGQNVSSQVDEHLNVFDRTSTFAIEFADVKAIIDREFNSLDAQHMNDYSNMTMRVEYAAILNEKAALNSGRPGFENDVRLHFSNDPDSTGNGHNTPNPPPKDQPKGKTPWDTVVAFTYKLDGLKTNDRNLSLQGAQFKLYHDQDGTKEVFVKQQPQGHYTVVNKDSFTGDAPADAATITSNDQGNFVIAGLDSGTYYLKEVKAPQGYRQLLDPIKVEVTAQMATERNQYVKGDGATDNALKTLSARAEIKSFYNQLFKTETPNLNTDIEKGSAALTVVNEIQSKLPATGQSLMFGVLALGVGVVGFSFFKLKKQSKTEE